MDRSATVRPPALLRGLGHVESGTGHAERTEQALLLEFLQRLADTTSITRASTSNE